ncbi:hypothetical protein [Deinococcus radiotolerans]|uniref:Uncharacterized protein n=1 Tax=Deinococcus radiotolerans TaxID=1309407 RepID=A0ABQ2FR48_9DEIO|nr:hypothetical protein [Deinococcus radiotolerans]GGL18798.1 hypothetical protein GCM10010844_42130 [Deinococcus radiotolerans]
MTAAALHAPDPADHVVPEGTIIHVPAGPELRVNGVRVPYSANVNHTPHIVDSVGGHLAVHLHDWVGRLAFTDAAGQTTVTFAYPRKLHPDPGRAFAALACIADDLRDLDHTLTFPQALHVSTDGLHVLPGRADLERAAQDAAQLTRRWSRQPRTAGPSRARVVRGGAVPDRVDWPATFDLWARGSPGDHVARDLTAGEPPPGAAALRALWTTLHRAAQQAGHAPVMAAAQRALATLPDGPARASRDGVSTAAAAATQRLHTTVLRATGRPSGAAVMPDLYERWVQVQVLRATGAVHGTFTPDSQGRWTGVFRGPDVQVTLNPKLGFRGVGAAHQQFTPDLLIETGRRAAVLDVKYRDLSRLGTPQQRELNTQLLTYMGATHAPLGIVAWPDPGGTSYQRTALPGGRAHLLRLNAHPLTPRAEFTAALLQHLQGTP